MEDYNLKFIAPSSRFHPGFWEQLYSNTLNEYNNPSFSMPYRKGGTILDNMPLLHVPISCALGKNDRNFNECFEFSANSFVEGLNVDNLAYKGFLYVTKTLEEFRDLDKQQLLQTIGRESIYKNITSGQSINSTKLLNSFILLVYCDLKQYKFTYWLGVPAILPSFPFTLVEQGPFASTACNESPIRSNAFLPLKDLVRESEKEKFEYSDLNSSDLSANEGRDSAETDRKAWFDPIQVDSNNTEIIEVDNLGQRMVLQIFHHLIAVHTATPSMQSVFALQIDDSQLRILSLSEAWNERFDLNTFFVCADMSSTPSALGWNIRNFLALLAAYPSSEAGLQSVRIIGLRSKLTQQLLKGSERRAESQLASENTLDSVRSFNKYILSEDNSVVVNVVINRAAFPDCSSLRVVGWETNERLKPGPRVADLSSVLSSEVLMAQAVDLNLRLMKWRMWTDLDLEKLKRTRCLLIGAGTLGCAVARTLLGWGVTNLTLVDSGVVSYSNPTRQCLFEFADCERREKKSVAAANALRRIFPGVQARGVVLTVPMPGHIYSSNDKDCSLETAFYELEELIINSDVVFTLTDSREARWLPTVLCAARNIQLINSALGFDSFLVMRHGIIHQAPSDSSLGCYFCNDIVAAGNSQRDRTMDQQCTVTRPGLAFVAASLAVEMMVALSQDRAADVSIPHQIRGNFRDFSQMHFQSPAFSCCTACCPAIVEKFKPSAHPTSHPQSQNEVSDAKSVVEFLRQVCEDPKILEVVSGVAKLTADVNLDLCVDSDEEF